jgi:hypothetical protein
VERIRLAAGVLRVSVPHQHQGHRFLVTLPDGEIEVRGTRFEVEVRDQRTRRLEVRDGLVALRLAGRHEQLLAAGSRWSPPASVGEPEVVARHDGPGSSAAGPVLPASAPAPHALRAAAPRVATETLASFVAGLDALHRGDLAAAATLFAAFEREHPDDDRAEDAGYLRVVALRRVGTSGAAAAAESYLRRYARGARRWDAVALIAAVGRTGLTCAELGAIAAEFEGDAARRSALRPLMARCPQ